MRCHLTYSPLFRLAIYVWIERVFGSVCSLQNFQACEVTSACVVLPGRCDSTSGCGAWQLIPTPEHGGSEDTRCHILGALNTTGCTHTGADGTWCGAKVAGNFSCSIVDHHPKKPRWPLYWSAPFKMTAGQVGVDVRVLVDRSVTEVFVQGGRATGLLAYTPPDQSMTHAHLFAEGGTAVNVSGVNAWSMSCGWNTTH